jgi:C-terminal processing protease CtpA/Prc
MCQQGTVPVVDDAKQAAVIDQLAAKLSAGYVLPDSTPKIVQALRAAQQSGEYAQARTPQDFVAAVNRTLFTASHDKHLRLYYDPGSGSPISFPTSGKPRFNFGFNKVERLPGNIGYLELLSFQPPERAAETVRDFMGALANFDAVIVDLRNNGGGTTPGMALVASYFFAAEKVHLSNLYWRDTDTMVEIWTSPQAPGRHSPHQPLYILTSASTFSAAEDFTYSLQKLKRAIVIGERTGGGAHSGKGLQRLSPLFTAFIPVGRSFSPVTNTNWEGVGVEPDITTTAEQALHVAHMTALRRLLENESDEQWKQNLQTALQELSAPRQPR